MTFHDLFRDFSKFSMTYIWPFSWKSSFILGMFLPFSSQKKNPIYFVHVLFNYKSHFPWLSMTHTKISWLSRPGKWNPKIPWLSRFSMAHTNPVNATRSKPLITYLHKTNLSFQILVLLLIIQYDHLLFLYMWCLKENTNTHKWTCQIMER